MFNVHCSLWSADKKTDTLQIKVNIFGGNPAFKDPMSLLDLENPEANGEIYDNWASSVKDRPELIDQKA